MTSTTTRAVLLINRYPSIFIPFAFLSMAIFHVPLFLNKRILFYKLLGTGKNGTFDIHPDFNQWALLFFYKSGSDIHFKSQEEIQTLSGTFIWRWWKWLGVKTNFIHLYPYAGHGTWDNNPLIEPHQVEKDPEGKIAILTRATIRLSRLSAFWKAVPGTARDMDKNPGFLYSIGIGEIPFIKQATLSIWESIEHMKGFAYQKPEHQEVIRRTRKEKWYSEDMFMRFKVIQEDVHLNT